MRFTYVVGAALLSLGIAGSAAAVPCSSMTSATSYASFDSCTVIGGGAAGQDKFSIVDAIVAALFGDEGISLTAQGSYSPGPLTGTEFTASRPSAGMVFSGPVAGNTSFTFTSVPLGTLFISLKQQNGFELFGLGLPGRTGTPFTLSHSLGGASTSHLSSFAGVQPVPLPAAGMLLLTAFGMIVLWRRRIA